MGEGAHYGGEDGGEQGDVPVLWRGPLAPRAHLVNKTEQKNTLIFIFL
jgi:hypothetical protein